jgi:glycosyltransferase involved in cell wall biosynthesis/SAM-dependent methyltransferase
MTGKMNPMIDLNLFSPQNNYASKTRYRNSAVTRGAYVDDSVVWQQAVYETIFTLMNTISISRVVDLGCGSGLKSHNMKKFDQELVMVDIHDFRSEKARVEEFLDCDFSSHLDLGQLENQLRSDEPTFFILSDVIEHLSDPRPLLRSLRKLLKQNADSRLFLSTPNRDLVNPLGHMGPPENKRHIREWNVEELKNGLVSAGFVVQSIVHLPQNNFDEYKRCMMFELSCSEESYRQFLQNLGKEKSPTHLILATEHAATGKSGGIGSYLEHVSKGSNLDPLILFTGNRGIESNPLGRCEDLGWVHSREFSLNAQKAGEDELDYDGVLEATIQILFLFDSIKIVEYSDYTGIGFRIGQASRAGLLPSDVKVVCYCHGSTFYIDHGFGKPDENRDLVVDLREKISIESADIAVFPSNFLMDLYSNKQGLHLPETKVLQYPVTMNPLDQSELLYQDLDTVIFYGKANPQKGYAVFVDSLIELQLKYPEIATRINRVILAGVESRNVPDELKEFYNVSCFQGSRTEAISLLQRYKYRAVVVLPYLADNQPIAIYEVIDSGSRLLTFNTGGIPEQIPSDFHEKVLTEANSASLANGVFMCFGESRWDRASITSRLHDEVSRIGDFNLENYNAYFRELAQRIAPVKPFDRLDSTTAVLRVDSTKNLEDRIDNVINSGQAFSRVLLVVNEKIKSEFELFISSRLFAEIDHCYDEPSDLSNWEERAASQVRTEFLTFLESRHRISNEYLNVNLELFSRNQRVAAAISKVAVSKSEANWNSSEFLVEEELQVGFELALTLDHENLTDGPVFWRTRVLNDFEPSIMSLARHWRQRQQVARILVTDQTFFVNPARIAFRVPSEELPEKNSASEFDSWMSLFESLNLPKNQVFALVRSFSMHVLSRSYPSDSRVLSEDSKPTEKELLSRLRSLELENFQIKNSRTWRYTSQLRLVIDRLKRLRKLLGI